MQVLNEDTHKTYYDTYQSIKFSFQKFINLKGYFLDYKQLIKTSQSFLQLKNVKYCDYHNKCQILLRDFYKIEIKEEDIRNRYFKDANTVCKLYKGLLKQLEEWHKIKESQKKDLFEFLMKIIEEHQDSIIDFFQRFSIPYTLTDFNDFMKN